MKNFRQKLHQMIVPSFIVLVCIAILVGCQAPRKKKKNGAENNAPEEKIDFPETTTQGEMSLGIDNGMAPVMNQLVDAFLRDHVEATINTTIAPEGVLMQQLLADSLRMILIGRLPTKAEVAAIKKDKIRATSTMIARDAVAVILNPAQAMDSLTMEQLGKLLNGEAKTWRDIGGDSDQEVALIFDDPKSGCIRLLQDQLMKPDQSLPSNAYLANGQEGVIKYVQEAKNAIGFIGYCWVSDRDEPKVQERLEKVKLARLAAADTSDIPGYFVRPYQNEITLGRYPLSRTVYAVSREHYVGLGTGFVVYSAGELGQRILLKAGLVPAFMPPRMVVLPEKED
jgi:phosphate transport system substrate-binding protein